MRNLLALISGVLLVAIAANLSIAAFNRQSGRGYYIDFNYVLHHADGSDGALVLGVAISPEVVELRSQLHMQLLNREYRERLVEPGMGPLHILDIYVVGFLPWLTISPAVQLRVWWRRRGQRKRGFPVTLK